MHFHLAEGGAGVGVARLAEDRKEVEGDPKPLETGMLGVLVTLYLPNITLKVQHCSMTLLSYGLV